jgi:hypothetical protein
MKINPSPDFSKIKYMFDIEHIERVDTDGLKRSPTCSRNRRTVSNRNHLVAYRITRQVCHFVQANLAHDVAAMHLHCAGGNL